MEKIGDIIKKVRKDKNMTQQELADLSGQKQPTIVRWETGKLTISHENLKIVAKALDLSPKYFYDLLQTVSPDKMEVAIDKLKHLSPKHQRHVVDLIDLFSETPQKK